VSFRLKRIKETSESENTGSMTGRHRTNKTGLIGPVKIDNLDSSSSNSSALNSESESGEDDVHDLPETNNGINFLNSQRSFTTCNDQNSIQTGSSYIGGV
jgi:hypothetical protein